jgi:outer membrane protein assembly factor BamB
MVLVLCSCTANSPSSAASKLTIAGSWPMYQLRADHNAVIAPSGLRAHWTFDAGSMINSGIAYVGDEIIFDTFGKQIIALDARSGAIAWRATSDNILMSTPAVANGIVFVGTGSNAHGANMKAFAYDPVGTMHNLWGRAEGDHVVALDAATGEQRWHYRTAGEDMPSMAVSGGLVLFANGDAHAYGLRASSGDLQWRTDLPGVSTMASTTMIGPLALFSVCDFEHGGAAATLALDAKTGAVRWRAPYGNCDSSPAYGGGRIYTSGVIDSKQTDVAGGYAVIAALDPHNGKALWTYRSPSPGPYTSVGTNERAIAGTYADGAYFQALPTEGALVAFDAATGSVRWRFHTAGPVKMSPVVDRGTVYFGDGAGLLYEVDEKRGSLRRTHIFKEPFSCAPPVIVGHTLLYVDGSTVGAMIVE